MAGQEHDQRHILRHPVLGGCRLGCQAGCGILPALVLWVRIGINESPRYQCVTAQMVRQELKKQFDIFSSFRSYPRESVIATLVYFLYRFKHTPTPSPRFSPGERREGSGARAVASAVGVWACRRDRRGFVRRAAEVSATNRHVTR
jgi:hypothetical protein